MADFETEYRKWMDMHLRKRKGERLRMLKEQHGYGEKLFLQEAWWPVVGSFEFLHPEYEVMDDEGNYYYLDYAYIRSPQPMDIETDGFNPHARHADRRSFKKGRRRQNSIVLSDWHILRFAVDDIEEDPEYCRKTLRRALECWYGEERGVFEHLPLRKREIVRLMRRSSRPVTPAEVGKYVGITSKYARELLSQLIEQNIIESASGQRRIRSYQMKRKMK